MTASGMRVIIISLFTYRMTSKATYRYFKTRLKEGTGTIQKTYRCYLLKILNLVMHLN